MKRFALALALLPGIVLLACGGNGNAGFPAATACQDLESCCSTGTFPGNGRAGCDALIQARDDTACAQALGSYVSAGACSSSAPVGPGGPGGDGCAIVAGAYRVHFAPSSAPGCPTPSDTDVTVTSSNPIPTSNTDSGLTCTTVEGSCSFTSTCAGDTSGYSTAAVISVDVADGTISGKETVTSTMEATGSVLLDCTYDFVYVPQ